MPYPLHSINMNLFTTKVELYFPVIEGPIRGTDILPCAAWQEDDGTIMIEPTPNTDDIACYSVFVDNVTPGERQCVADFPPDQYKQAIEFEKLLRTLAGLPDLTLKS